jgi:hypothetical protein
MYILDLSHSLSYLIGCFKSGFPDLVGGVSISLVTLGLTGSGFCLWACMSSYCISIGLWSAVFPFGAHIQ